MLTLEEALVGPSSTLSPRSRCSSPPPATPDSSLLLGRGRRARPHHQAGLRRPPGPPAPGPALGPGAGGPPDPAPPGGSAVPEGQQVFVRPNRVQVLAGDYII